MINPTGGGDNNAIFLTISPLVSLCTLVLRTISRQFLVSSCIYMLDIVFSPWASNGKFLHLILCMDEFNNGNVHTVTNSVTNLTAVEQEGCGCMTRSGEEDNTSSPATCPAHLLSNKWAFLSLFPYRKICLIRKLWKDFSSTVLVNRVTSPQVWYKVVDQFTGTTGKLMADVAISRGLLLAWLKTNKNRQLLFGENQNIRGL